MTKQRAGLWILILQFQRLPALTVGCPASNHTRKRRGPATGWRPLFNITTDVSRRAVCITEKEYVTIRVNEKLHARGRAPIPDAAHTLGSPRA